MKNESFNVCVITVKKFPFKFEINRLKSTVRHSLQYKAKTCETTWAFQVNFVEKKSNFTGFVYQNLLLTIKNPLFKTEYKPHSFMGLFLGVPKRIF